MIRTNGGQVPVLLQEDDSEMERNESILDGQAVETTSLRQAVHVVTAVLGRESSQFQPVYYLTVLIT
jgi:hypothetical protein